jgi:hypothetical protein
MDTADTIYSLADEPPRSAGRTREDRARLQPGAVGRGQPSRDLLSAQITPLGAVLCMETTPAVGEQLDLDC